MLDKYTQQKKDLDKIVPSQKIGLFHVKLNLLKNLVKPACEDLLELVEITMVKYVFDSKMFSGVLGKNSTYSYFIEVRVYAYVA